MWASGLDHCIQLILQEGRCRGEGLPRSPFRRSGVLLGSSRHSWGTGVKGDRFQEPCLYLSQRCDAVTLVHCCAVEAEFEIVLRCFHSLRVGVLLSWKKKMKSSSL